MFVCGCHGNQVQQLIIVYLLRTVVDHFLFILQLAAVIMCFVVFLKFLLVQKWLQQLCGMNSLLSASSSAVACRKVRKHRHQPVYCTAL